MWSKTIQIEVFVGSVHHKEMYKPICTFPHSANVGFTEKSHLLNDRLWFPWVWYQKGCQVPDAGMFVLEGSSLFLHWDLTAQEVQEEQSCPDVYLRRSISPDELEHSWPWKWDISRALNQVQTSEEEFTKVTKQSECHLSPNSNKAFFQWNKWSPLITICKYNLFGKSIFREPAFSEDVGLCSLLLWQYKPHSVIHFQVENYPPEPDWVKGRKAINLSQW